MTNTDNTTTAASIAADTAEVARVALTAALAKAKALGTASLTKAYGDGADSASVSLAVKAATVMAGGAKPRGGAAQRINDTIKAVEGAPVTAYTLALAARTVLDTHKAAEAARRKAISDERAAAKAVLNDRGRSKADRIAALEVMTEVDNRVALTKQANLTERITATLIAAREAGMDAQSILSMVEDVFPNVQHAPLVAVA